MVVGYGLAGRAFHCPLIRRQKGLWLEGIVARDPKVRVEGAEAWGVRGMASLEEALSDLSVGLVVIATPHDSHAELAVRALEAGKDCVVDKVMALSVEQADRMIAARDASGRMLSVFQNRRWDWDYLTLKRVLEEGGIGRPLLIESSVCRYAAPRSWRGDVRSAGTILHDWGAHLIDQALQLGIGPCRRLSASIIPATWAGVDSGGHGRVSLEFDEVQFQVETSRICVLDRARFWVVGSEGGLVKYGVDPQEKALRAGRLDEAEESEQERTRIRRHSSVGEVVETCVEPIKGGWDEYYANIAEYLAGRAGLAVTAEQGKEVVCVLEAAERAARDRVVVEGPWGG